MTACSFSRQCTDEIRQPEFEELSKNPEIRKQELDMAKSLIENLSDSFNPESFVDNYRERLAAAVQAKVEGMEVAVAPTKEPTQIVDLMEALKASVEATKKKAEEDSDSKKGSEKGSQKARSA